MTLIVCLAAGAIVFAGILCFLLKGPRKRQSVKDVRERQMIRKF